MLVHRATKPICVLDRVRLNSLCVSVCIVELAVIEKHPHQGVIDPEWLVASFERGCDCKSRLKEEFPLFCPRNGVFRQDGAKVGRSEIRDLSHEIDG